ncbi:MAG: SpoIID/LytB domain-containing protein [Ruminococcaceae bacterium]|nr:SpoIID/LytB domain-containing protein [Oscillospiraceae bacterium]
MKNLISVFVLLAAINISLPVVYYHIYYRTPAGHAGSEDAVAEQTDPFVQDNNNFFQNSTPDNTYTLYNLETHELEEMDLVSFLVGSAACEMPASYEMQAIKAQMIACHSYYLYCKQNGVPHDDLNLSFDERYMQKYASKERLQEYWGLSFDDNYHKFLKCADEVKNLILTCDGEVALTTYYAVSCGKTQSSDAEWGAPLDYLTIVESSADALSDNYLKVKNFTVQEMYDRFMTSFSGINLDMAAPESWIGNIVYNESGYVDTVEVNGVKILGRDFRKYFELNSSCFMIFYDDNQFSVATKGYGHGVGMSQFGANQLSQQGKNYTEILAHYFPGTQLGSI